MNTTTITRDALKKLFGISYQVLKKNLEGVTHEESLLQPEADGNCLNWVVGHILSTRNSALQMMNQPTFWNQEEAGLYKRGSEPIKNGSRAQNFKKMATDLDRSQELLMKGLSEISDTQLNSACPDPSIGETMKKHSSSCNFMKRITQDKLDCSAALPAAKV